jgi:tRNA threonylcarbamoyladenosine biosynthesis protein TsaE
MDELLVSYRIDDLANISETLISLSGTNKIFLFYGEMGAGKTTLIKSLCEHLGVTEPVTSPTFSIVNEYKARESKIFHFDFYRLKNETEALDLGYEEYFYSGAHCFIEWPEKIPNLLPEHYVRVKIEVTGHDSREIIAENI